MARDIGSVMEYVDFEQSGFFSAKQVGQILVILNVFSQLFAENKVSNQERLAREEVFLMHFWHLINPLNNGETVESRVIFTFLKLIYDPYQDGSK